MTPPPDDNGQSTPNAEEMNNPAGDSVDPLQWLESLAARQGANPEEFITSADLDIPEPDADAVVDEPGYVDYDPFGSGSAGSSGPASEAAPSSEESEAASVSSDSQPTEDVDPLAWLESLARRQGANPEEFVTEANIEVPEVSADVEIDEPGYTPYEISSTPKSQPTPPPEPEPAPEPAAQQEELTPSEAAAMLGLDTDELTPAPAEAAPQPEPAAAAPTDPLSGSVDPLAWLESLAKRQGAKSEELITAADIDVPEPEAGAAVDEPGYVDYTPFSEEAEAAEEGAIAQPPAAEPSPPPEPEQVPAAALEEEGPSAGDTLAWLEGLAAEAEQAPEAPPAPVATGDPLAGLSTEEIEQRAARGELTAEQMEAWLRRQAESLAQHRAEAATAFEEGTLPPPEPAEIPGWLQEAMPEEGAPATEPAPLVEEITEPPQPADLPDWLEEKAPAEADSELMELLGESAPEAEAAPAISGLTEVSPEEIYEDSWAAALEEEYTQQLQPAEEEPEWYRTALEDPERQAALEAELAAQEAAAAEAPAAEEEEAAPPEPAELPDWLAEAAPAEAAAEDMPDWLDETIPEAPRIDIDQWLAEEAPAEEAAAADMPDWLTEPVEVEEVPDWLAEAAPEAPAPAAEEAPVEAPPEPVSAPQPVSVTVETALPEGEAYAELRTRLEANPDDHAARLELARALNRNNELAACLGQYEALVGAEAMLSEVEADLRALADAQPAVPQVRRILGDALMRLGRLQDALDTYRAALEQL